MSEWKLFRGNVPPQDAILKLPDPPSWRDFSRDAARPKPPDYPNRALRPLDPTSRDARRGAAYRVVSGGETPAAAAEPPSLEVELVNAALYLRRPLLITGSPGTGKSSLAFAVAYELQLGPVLYWPISSRASLTQGLYRYDAVGRLQEAAAPTTPREPNDATAAARDPIGDYIRLGPLGTAFLPSMIPRVLLIDEIDKSDIDLPNDLLNIFEEGEFEIPELSRLPDSQSKVEVRTHDGGKVTLERGRVRCWEFPLVMMTSNAEREFPPAFLRRCLRLDIPKPGRRKLDEIVESHFKPRAPEGSASVPAAPEAAAEAEARRAAEVGRAELVEEFLKRRDRDDLATDQLLNALYLLTRPAGPGGDDRSKLIEALLRSLAGGGNP
jgi:MoxR-like ATPase